MRISFVHYFHPKTASVKDIGPSVDHMALAILNGLIEVEAVQIEGHCAYTKSSKPDPNHGPSSQEEVERTGVIEGSILKNKATKIPVCGHNVIGFLFLAKAITVVLALLFGCFTNQRAGYERAVPIALVAAAIFFL